MKNKGTEKQQSNEAFLGASENIAFAALQAHTQEQTLNAVTPPHKSKSQSIKHEARNRSFWKGHLLNLTFALVFVYIGYLIKILETSYSVESHEGEIIVENVDAMAFESDSLIGERYIFESPHRSSQIIGFLSLSAKQELSAFNDDWFALDAGGFVLKVDSGKKTDQLMRVTSEAQQVFSGPGRTHKVVGAYYRGKVVKSLGQKDSWVKFGPNQWMHLSGLKALLPKSKISLKN